MNKPKSLKRNAAELCQTLKKINKMPSPSIEKKYGRVRNLFLTVLVFFFVSQNAGAQMIDEIEVENEKEKLMMLIDRSITASVEKKFESSEQAFEELGLQNLPNNVPPELKGIAHPTRVKTGIEMLDQDVGATQLNVINRPDLLWSFSLSRISQVCITSREIETKYGAANTITAPDFLDSHGAGIYNYVIKTTNTVSATSFTFRRSTPNQRFSCLSNFSITVVPRHPSN